MSSHSCPGRRACRCAAGAVLGLCLAAAPTRALDFQLHSVTVEEDGFKREQVYFQQDAQTRVGITPPAGWSRADDAGSLTLIPPNVTHGMVKIEKSSVAASVAFQGSGLEVYRKRVLAEIPQGATGTKPSDETADPLPVFNWKSREFTVDYEFFGQSYRRSVLFLDLNAREQVTMTTVSLKQDFERIHAAGLDVLRSWQVLPVLP